MPALPLPLPYPCPYPALPLPLPCPTPTLPLPLPLPYPCPYSCPSLSIGLHRGNVQPGARRWESPAGPLIMDGYYRPPASTPDGLTLEVVGDVLGGGRTSRLYTSMVVPSRALNASVVSSYPGEA